MIYILDDFNHYDFYNNKKYDFDIKNKTLIQTEKRIILYKYKSYFYKYVHSFLSFHTFKNGSYFKV